MQTDYLILGQGIAGTLLSRCLLKEGKTVLVIDNSSHFSASMACGGIINPVTGKRSVESWMIGQLLPFARDTYREMERELNVPLIKECDILEFHANGDLRLGFEDKISGGNSYLQTLGDDTAWQEYFRFNYGVGKISPCLVLDAPALIKGWQEHLIENGSLLDEPFHWADCKIENGGIAYKNITAQKIICCEGAAGENNPYFKMLPWSKDKGEALIASIPGLPDTHIYKQGISIVPKGNNIFWIGATHDWKYTDLNPTPGFRKAVEDQLGYWLKLPYKITEHVVALRPANFERKPFVGLHPQYPEIGILNGMGGKGCSLAPFFARQLTRLLVYNEPILHEADVSRFNKILQRGINNGNNS